MRVRFRPVFMTAFGTIAGMIPIAFEWAVGLERLSPLADVAVGRASGRNRADADLYSHVRL